MKKLFAVICGIVALCAALAFGDWALNHRRGGTANLLTI